MNKAAGHSSKPMGQWVMSHPGTIPACDPVVSGKDRYTLIEQSPYVLLIIIKHSNFYSKDF